MSHVLGKTKLNENLWRCLNTDTSSEGDHKQWSKEKQDTDILSYIHNDQEISVWLVFIDIDIYNFGKPIGSVLQKERAMVREHMIREGAVPSGTQLDSLSKEVVLEEGPENEEQPGLKTRIGGARFGSHLHPNGSV